MNVLVVGGSKVNNIVDAIGKCFSPGSIDFLMEKDISNMERFYDSGRYFDRALIIDAGVTDGLEAWDVAGIRERVSKFVEAIQHRSRGGVRIVFVCGTEAMAEVIYQETLAIATVTKVLIKEPPYTVSFMVEAVYKGLDELVQYEYTTYLKAKESGQDSSGDDDDEGVEIDAADATAAGQGAGAFTVTEQELADTDLPGADVDFDGEELGDEDLFGGSGDFFGDADGTDGEYAGAESDQGGADEQAEPTDGDDEEGIDGSDGDFFQTGRLPGLDDGGFVDAQEQPIENGDEPGDDDGAGLFGSEGSNDDFWGAGETSDGDQGGQDDFWGTGEASEDGQNDFWGTGEGQEDGQNDFWDGGEPVDDSEDAQQAENSLGEPDGGASENDGHDTGFGPGSLFLEDEQEELDSDTDAGEDTSEDAPDDEGELVGADALGFTDQAEYTDTPEYGDDNSEDAETDDEPLEDSDSEELPDDWDTQGETERVEETPELFGDGQEVEANDQPDGFGASEYSDDDSDGEAVAPGETDKHDGLDAFAYESYSGGPVTPSVIQAPNLAVPSKKDKRGKRTAVVKTDGANAVDVRPKKHETTASVSGVSVSDAEYNDLKVVLNTLKLRGNIITVTGMPCTGKTTLVANLADVAEKLGCSVLMVDLDVDRRGLAYQSKLAYDAVHSLDVSRSAIREAVNNSAALASLASILSPGKHLVTTGLASDKLPKDWVTADKLSKLCNNARAQYHLVVIDMPWDFAVSTGSTVMYNSDEVIVTSGLNTHDLMSLVLGLCNIEDESLANLMWTQTRLMFTHVRGGIDIFGKKVTGIKQVMAYADKQITELLGEEAEYAMRNIGVCGQIPYDPSYDGFWMSKARYTNDQRRMSVYIDALRRILVGNK